MRGEIWRFAGSDGCAFLIVQHDALTMVGPTVTALAVTGNEQDAGEPLTIPLTKAESGTGHPAWVKITQVHTLPVRAATERIGALAPERMRRVDSALGEVLALSI